MPRKNEQPRTDELAGLTYEEALAELDGIVKKMEAGNRADAPGLTIEESLTAYKRGIALLNFCEQALVEAERQLQILDDGKLTDFKP